ncbi:uncharacterized protein BO95DRAFT_375240 [Aspergillus brunneoviolaceus CBS 621.78]|uniref:Uncharacterized protein n=1 Tax=Aspergillus brunneoviolaceus CBS 621.78 TaxID=1450534 RepID=A0ACD1FUC7_9EURO|nr:hypothetical protein BO95DRAFT_375240 [Aspergillus brunneoviolaceus CBS 621.78]RAH40569.1 hypothetical protein BO95DRAFT_375240 [Aspergillus brunneoviolaceus CBS 621.78]
MPHPETDFPDLYVNDGQLDPQRTGLLEATCPRTTPMAEMRHRLERDGYLYLKGLLPRADVLEARRKYFEMLAPTGILDPRTSPIEGIFDRSQDATDFPGFGTGRHGTGTTTSDTFMMLALRAHAEDWHRNDLCKHPALIAFVEDFTGWGKSTWALERTILRNNLPGNPATGVHYDYIFLRHGEHSVLTAWVPVGDIALNGGGLIYLENGHVLGRATEGQFTSKAQAAGLSEEEAKTAFNQNMMSNGMLSQDPRHFGEEHQRRWLVSAYEAGDVVFHDSYMIHASTLNHDTNGVIRLGTDLRFVDGRGDWDTRWASIYRDDDGL